MRSWELNQYLVKYLKILVNITLINLNSINEAGEMALVRFILVSFVM